MNVYGYTALEGYFAKPTGVGKHIEQMFRALASADDCRFTMIAARDQVGPDGKIPAHHPLADLPVQLLPYSRRGIEQRWKWFSRPYVDRWCPEADWVYCGYDRFIPARRVRVAATIHSLYWFDPDCPGYESRAFRSMRFRARNMFEKIIRRADLLPTVSHFLKSQMVDWFGADPAKVVVVGNGAENEYFDAAKLPRIASNRPYVVAVSGLNALDGAPYVLSVARSLLKLDADLEIVVAGHQNEPPYIEQAKDLPNIRLLGYVPKEKLAQLMHNSVALLFLNRYESFGVAAVEAMAAGAPVIGTRFTAVPEVVQNAGLLADVDKPDEIAQTILSLARSETLRSTYVTLGARRAEEFRWESCTARLLQALRSFGR